jgi:hypothetical protein
MPKFNDATGVDWELTLTVGGLEALREIDANFLLGEPTETFARLERDPVLLCQVAWVLCESQAKERKIDQKAFYDRLYGDTLNVLTEALLASIVNFIPSHSRALLKTSVEKNKAIHDLLVAKAMSKINDDALSQRLVAAAERAMDNEIENLMNRFESVGNSRASSESIRAS